MKLIKIAIVVVFSVTFFACSQYEQGASAENGYENGIGTIKYSIPISFNSVSAGQWHSFAIMENDSLWAWGMNWSGQLGDGTATGTHVPIKIMDGVASASAGGGHSMAVKTDGSLWTWGANEHGQLGDGTKEYRLTPEKIMEGVASVSAGNAHSLAVRTDGSLWAWGANNGGQLGDGTTEEIHIPIEIMGGVVSVAAGPLHSLVLKADGSLWYLGGGTSEFDYAPIKIMEGVASISHTFAVGQDGGLWAIDGYTPLRTLENVALVNDDVAIRTDGSLCGFKSDEHYFYGDYRTTWGKNWIHAEKIVDDVVAAAAGGNRGYAVKSDGSLWAFGDIFTNAYGSGMVLAAPQKMMDGLRLPDKNMPLFEEPLSLEPEIKVIFNGEELVFDQPPVPEEFGWLMVPVRVIFEALGAVVEWDGVARAVSANKDGVRIRLMVGSHDFTVNGEEIFINIQNRIVNGRTLIQPHAIVGAFDVRVVWDEHAGIVYITN